MLKEGSFQNSLYRTVVKKIIILLVGSGILFTIGISLVTFITKEVNAVNNLKMLEDVFHSLYERNVGFLKDEEILDSYKSLLSSKGENKELRYAFERFRRESDVKNEIIVSDGKGEILYTSYDPTELTNYLINYNAAICYNAKNNPSKEIYNAVYYSFGNYSDYIFVKTLYESGEPIGYISLYLSGSDWNYFLSGSNFDGIITDNRDNVIYCSKPSLVSNLNKFNKVNGRIYYNNNDRYWMASKTLDHSLVNIYSLVHYPNSPALIIGVIIIIIMGIFWFCLVNWMANSMAKNNADHINKLVKEIRIIRKIDKNHRIKMDTGDEFSEVAYQINYMLDHIDRLNNKNTELLQINNKIEMNQLTTQINPHFLYNTLEIIRNLAMRDGERASDLITRLSQILRYSIDNHKQDVYLEEDMDFINEYLEIQGSRFEDLLSYTIKIDEECNRCLVPKLVLQPIIENSIKYGFKEKMNLNIEIKGYMEDHVLILSVKDDGFGMKEEEAQKLDQVLKSMDNPTSSHGLYNISRRLYLEYGVDSGIEIRNKEGIGFETIIKVTQKNWGLQHV